MTCETLPGQRLPVLDRQHTDDRIAKDGDALDAESDADRLQIAGEHIERQIAGSPVDFPPPRTST